MLVKSVLPDSSFYKIKPIFHCRLKQSALASLKSGNKKTALKHARELKITTESREKVASLLNRVEEVLNAIADAESTKTVGYHLQFSSVISGRCSAHTFASLKMTGVGKRLA